MPLRTYEVEVVGESYANADGSSRQMIIQQLSVGDAITLQPEPDNPYSSRALKVISARGQIGYVGKGQSWVLDRVHEGRVADVRVQSIRGGGGSTLGVWLDVRIRTGDREKVAPHEQLTASRSTWLSRLLQMLGIG